MRNLLAPLAALALTAAVSAAPPVERGTFRFAALDDQKATPARYRLDPRDVKFTLSPRLDMPAAGVRVSTLTFPSPFVSKTPQNNTVHAQYYRPEGKGPFPAVIVLDITGGNQLLSRFISTHLARNGVAALFVQMAYYGPRRPAGSKLRLMSTNLPMTTEAVTQTVLDLRVAAAWLAARPEIDPKRLGISGTSLGSFVSALTGEMEPRLGRVCVLLGGGGFVDGYTGHPLVAPYMGLVNLFGGLKGIRKAIEPIDPLTCAANLKGRDVLIMAASKDEIVPPKMATMLWEASGKQQIHWYDAGHYTAALSIADALEKIVGHFKR